MMRSTFSVLISAGLLLMLFFAAACSDFEHATQNQPAAAMASPTTTGETTSPRAEVVRAAADAVEVAAGGSAEAAVHLSVAEGFHINANPAAMPNLIPTELKIESSDANVVIKADAPVYPSSITKKFEFSEQPLKVYEGEAIIKLPLRVESSAAKGTYQLRANLRTQACDNQSCYPPRTVGVFIPVNVR